MGLIFSGYNLTESTRIVVTLKVAHRGANIIAFVIRAPSANVSPPNVMMNITETRTLTQLAE